MRHQILNFILLNTFCIAFLSAQGVTPLPQTFFDFDELHVNGTTGTPLGGFGSGGLKYNANDGTFAVMLTPPADAYDFQKVDGAAIELTVNGVTTLLRGVKGSDGRTDDDALWPIHRVNFGNINGIEANMIGFSPFDNREYNNMHLPYAFFEVSMKNTTKHDADITLNFAFPDDNETWTVASNGNTGILKAGKTMTAHIVVAWYDNTDPELAYYKNLYTSPRPIAEHGLKVFSRLKDNAVRIADSMRGSSLPHWFQNQVLNTLSSVVLNSMYKKDGRVAFAEGQWTCFGTMDQMWLARQIICQSMPFYAWRELEYWARTQMKNGQIHHDFNRMDVGNQREKRSVLVSWDDTEHRDYRDVQKWVDLNCGFIISVYEAYRITGDRDEFLRLWPNMKRAADRVEKQVELFGNKKYPLTFDGSENSYDAGGNPDPYNANISAVTYKIMALLSAETGENDNAEKYEKSYETVVKSFSDRYLKGNDPLIGKHCENVFSGQALAYHLRLGQMWDKSETDTVISRLNNFYYPYYWGLGYPGGTYDEWTPYLLVHYGGLLLNTGRLNEWYVLQKDAYMRQYQNRDRVFDHPLNILPAIETPTLTSRNIKSKKQYISIPSVWRNYYDVIGYSHDARTKELWLTPILYNTSEIRDAYFMSPETDGTITVNETPAGRTIILRTTNALPINNIHLRDDFCDDVTVRINGKIYVVKREGEGYARELIAPWKGKATSEGLVIEISGKRKTAVNYHPAKPDRDFVTAFQLCPMSPFDGLHAAKADRQAGTQVMNNYVTSCNNFDYILFANVDFAKNGTSAIVMRVNSIYGDSELEVVLDDNSGTAVGSYKLPCTDGEWKELKFPINKIKGIHNIVLRFFGSHSDNLMDIDYIKFE